MATIAQRPTVELQTTLLLSEAELRALHALSEYGSRNVLEVVEAQISTALVRDHGAGLRSLIESVRTVAPVLLGRLHAARAAFDDGE